jgi:hypothetical protein
MKLMSYAKLPFSRTLKFHQINDWQIKLIISDFVEGRAPFIMVSRNSSAFRISSPAISIHYIVINKTNL